MVLILAVIVGYIAMLVLSPLPVLGPIIAGFIAGLIIGGIKNGMLAGFLSGTIEGMVFYYQPLAVYWEVFLVVAQFSGDSSVQ
jgi:mannose/fructose/N-acetylgalactosamine-specific phosphotransferase system component IIC